MKKPGYPIITTNIALKMMIAHVGGNSGNNIMTFVCYSCKGRKFKNNSEFRTHVIEHKEVPKVGVEI